MAISVLAVAVIVGVGVLDEGGRSDSLEETIARHARCESPCQITGRIPIDHPRWGPIEVVTFGPVPGTVVDHCGHDLVQAIDRLGAVVWTSGPSAGCGWYEFGPAGSTNHGSAVPDPVDASGRIFLDWNPGRHNGVTVLVPTAEGFDDLSSLPTPDYQTRFYGARAVEPDGEGTYDILYECCSGAGAPMWETVFSWDGHDFSPRPEAEPTPCGHEDVYDYVPDLHVIAELRDITVLGTTCYQVLTPDPYIPQSGSAIVRIVRTHDLDRDVAEFDLDGWQCQITNSGTGPSVYACTGEGAVTFTRLR